MALNKTPVAINFSQGLDTKTDDKQVQVGKFLAMNNSVFDKAGRLTKRNGYGNITDLPNSDQTTLTTLNDNLIATGSNLYAFSADTDQWLNQGKVQPVQLNVLPLVRVSTSQSSPDAAVASTGLTCLVYIDNALGYYQISDSVTGQQIVPRTALPSNATDARVFIMAQYFIITFIATIGGSHSLRYIAIPTANPGSPNAAALISSNLGGGSGFPAGYDAFSFNNDLYIAWGDNGTGTNLAFLNQSLVLSSVVVVNTTARPSLISVTVDSTLNPAVVWVTLFGSGNDTYVASFTQTLVPLIPSTLILNNVPLAEITSAASNGLLTIIYETLQTYSYSAVRSDYLSVITVTVNAVVSAPAVILRSVGLASKAFAGPTGTIYVLATYGGTNEPTYFLIDSQGAIYMRLAFSNGGGYASSQVLPTVSILNGTYYVPYMIKDFLAAVNKGTNLPSGTPVNGIYTQTGINLAEFTINTTGQHSSEIAGALHLTGGQLWEYDGVKPVEHSFHVYPEDLGITTSGPGPGNVGTGTYYYQFTYEWTDNQGNLHRSAPSIPISIVASSASSTNTINVPTLRLTYKQPLDPPTSPLVTNPVRIVGYRWSVAQQVYYQFTSITSPVLNDTTVDSIAVIDTNSDAAILGQTLLYTTGGVIENIAAPASIASALFKNRLFLIDAEDQNTLWFSKQVIEAVPVEMSDLLTLYIAPTSGAQGSTGPMTALSAMDDKLIIFKKDAIYYLTGTGPDNTGANNDFSDPIYITSSVGCANPSSIVLMPNGIMFQSDKGIWLLGRDLQTSYIGAPVEIYNSQTVNSAIAVPATNQVRFILDNNFTLMYDYYFNQWATHSNVYAISATLYQGEHTYLNNFAQVYQETPGMYLDGSTPVLMSLTTSWINIAGLQGYERFYFAFLLGTYITPFTLNVQFAYDYNPSPGQATTVKPDNYVAPWGGEALWGSGGAWGGPGNILRARVFPEKMKCESFQVIINEIYDPSFSITSADGLTTNVVQAGAGLTLSGLSLIVGIKKGYRTQSAAKSFG